MNIIDLAGKNFKTHTFVDEVSNPIFMYFCHAKVCSKCKYRIYMSIRNDRHLVEDVFDALSFGSIEEYPMINVNIEDMSLSCDEV
jgi:hypothetical protein